MSHATGDLFFKLKTMTTQHSQLVPNGCITDNGTILNTTEELFKYLYVKFVQEIHLAEVKFDAKSKVSVKKERSPPTAENMKRTFSEKRMKWFRKNETSNALVKDLSY